MNRTLLFLFVLLLPLAGMAQTDTTKNSMPPKFVAAMEKQVAILDTAYTPATLQQCYNSIERISNAEKSQWLPHYYMAYCLLMQSFTDDVSKTDDYCDKADRQIKQADSLSPKNSEVYVLRSLSASARIRVNPMKRGAKYGRESSVWLDTAQALDSTNPRVDLLRGQGLYYTPKAFGGGKDKAKPVLERSVRKYGTFVPASNIHPRWGRFRAQQLVAECDKPDGK